MTGHECTPACWEQIRRYGTRLTESCTTAAARAVAEGIESDIVDGGWTFSGEKGWLLDPSQEERVRRLNEETLARIDEAHAAAGFPTCALCGQRTLTLDEFGLCSKNRGEHHEWREDAKAKPGVRFR